MTFLLGYPDSATAIEKMGVSMLRNIIKLSVVLAIFGAAHPASANYACAGKVGSTYVSDVGNVYLAGDWRGTYTQVCNISQEWHNIPPEVCATWIAKIDAAVSLGRTLQVYYRGDGDCASLPHYNASPPPYYIMLR